MKLIEVKLCKDCIFFQHHKDSSVHKDMIEYGRCLHPVYGKESMELVTGKVKWRFATTARLDYDRLCGVSARGFDDGAGDVKAPVLVAAAVEPARPWYKFW